MATLQRKSYAKLLLPVSRLSTANSTAVRNRLISFPERPALSERYMGVEAVKAMGITRKAAVRPVPIIPQVTQVLKEPVLEENYMKANGISVIYVENLPGKYKRSTISEEEIEQIMMGGRD